MRASAHTGAAIRFPRREAWQAGTTSGKFVEAANSPEVLLSATPHRRSYGLSHRSAPRNDMQKFATCPQNSWALPVYCRKTSLHPLTHLRLLHTLRAPRPCNRRRVTVFCMSLRTSAHTGVAIRSPRREAWQAGCCLGKFVTPYVFALSAAFCHVLPQGLRIATSLRSSQ